MVPPGKVLSSGAGRIGSMAVKVQEAYEKYASRALDAAYKISDRYRKDPIWETIAKKVIEVGANPMDWVRAQFDMGGVKRPMASTMAGDKAEKNYRRMLSIVHDIAKPLPENVGKACEDELKMRIASLHAYLKDVANTTDPDSLNAMLYIDDKSWGIDPLAILLVSSEDMYLPIFASSAAEELYSRPEIMDVCRVNYMEKMRRILRYVERQHN